MPVPSGCSPTNGESIVSATAPRAAIQLAIPTKSSRVPPEPWRYTTAGYGPLPGGVSR